MDFSSLNISELRRESSARGLDSSGVKALLVARIEQHEATKAATAAVNLFVDFDVVFRSRLAAVDTTALGELGPVIATVPRALLRYTRSAPAPQQYDLLVAAMQRVRKSLSIAKRIKAAAVQSSISETIVGFFESIVTAVKTKPPPSVSTDSLRAELAELANAPALEPFPSVASGGPASASAAEHRALRREKMSSLIKDAVLGAFGTPRASVVERKIAQALVDGFRPAGTPLQVAPNILHLGVGLRQAVHKVILDRCLERSDSDEAMSLLAPFLAARAHLAVEGLARVTPCQWDVFVANSVVGDTGDTSLSAVDRALQTFESMSWISSSAPPAVPVSISAIRGPTIAISDSSAEPTSMPSLVPIQAGHVPHGIDLSSTQRESPLAGKSGKEWRDFVKGLALVPGWRCGRALVSGGASELGARLSAAHDALSRARNCLVGATTVDLADIPFGGFTGIPYEVTRVGDWAKLPSTAMRTLLETALRRDGVTVDAITGANLSIVANVIAAMVTKGMNIGIGHDPSSGAFFPDSSRFSD